MYIIAKHTPTIDDAVNTSIVNATLFGHDVALSMAAHIANVSLNDPTTYTDTTDSSWGWMSELQNGTDTYYVYHNNAHSDFAEWLEEKHK